MSMPTILNSHGSTTFDLKYPTTMVKSTQAESILITLSALHNIPVYIKSSIATLSYITSMHHSYEEKYFMSQFKLLTSSTSSNSSLSSMPNRNTESVYKLGNSFVFLNFMDFTILLSNTYLINIQYNLSGTYVKHERNKLLLKTHSLIFL